MDYRLYNSEGVLRYKSDPLKLILEVEQSIVDYYRSLIPRYWNSQPQRYRAHVSVVRNVTPSNMDMWGKREGVVVPFLYSDRIYNGEIYLWLNVFSVELEEIRRELGLPISSLYFDPPDGFLYTFHMTLANVKN